MRHDAEATKMDAALRLARVGLICARDLAAEGIPRTYLRRLCDRGLLERVDRGLYRWPDSPVTELHSLAEVARRAPRSTVCLLSALQVHGLTTELPQAVWIMIERHARRPRITYPSLEVVRASGAALAHGVEERRIEGAVVRITTPAKTVADCFRYRRRVGLDVALAALRDYLGRSHSRGELRRARAESAGAAYTVDALLAAAEADRALPLMRPYVEALA